MKRYSWEIYSARGSSNLADLINVLDKSGIAEVDKEIENIASLYILLKKGLSIEQFTISIGKCFDDLLVHVEGLSKNKEDVASKYVQLVKSELNTMFFGYMKEFKLNSEYLDKLLYIIPEMIFNVIDIVIRSFNRFLDVNKNEDFIVQFYSHFIMGKTSFYQVDQINVEINKKCFSLIDKLPRTDEDVTIMQFELDGIVDLLNRKRRLIKEQFCDDKDSVCELIIEDILLITSMIKKIKILYADDSWRDARRSVYNLMSYCFLSLNVKEVDLLNISNIAQGASLDLSLSRISEVGMGLIPLKYIENFNNFIRSENQDEIYREIMNFCKIIEKEFDDSSYRKLVLMEIQACSIYMKSIKHLRKYKIVKFEICIMYLRIFQRNYIGVLRAQ